MSDAIVVGTDGSDTAKRAVREAMRLARALDAEIHIVSAFEPLRGARVVGAPEGTVEAWIPLPDAAVNAVVEEAAADVRASGIPVRTHTHEGHAADVLLRVADDVDANMIVVGNRGMHGAARFVLGSVPNKVSHHAHCNVLIVATVGN